VQDGVGNRRFGGACGHELRLQVGQFGLQLTVDHDERAHNTAGITVAGGNEVIDFGIELGHKNLLPNFQMASIIGEVLHQY
jgi:hypothetical protein